MTTMVIDRKQTHTELTKPPFRYPLSRPNEQPRWRLSPPDDIVFNVKKIDELPPRDKGKIANVIGAHHERQGRSTDAFYYYLLGAMLGSQPSLSNAARNLKVEIGKGLTDQKVHTLLKKATTAQNASAANKLVKSYEAAKTHSDAKLFLLTALTLTGRTQNQKATVAIHKSAKKTLLDLLSGLRHPPELIDGKVYETCRDGSRLLVEATNYGRYLIGRHTPK